MVKSLPAMRETWLRFLSREDPLEKGRGNPLQYSFVENPMEGESWRATVRGGRRESDTSEPLTLVPFF